MLSFHSRTSANKNCIEIVLYHSTWPKVWKVKVSLFSRKQSYFFGFLHHSGQWVKFFFHDFVNGTVENPNALKYSGPDLGMFQTLDIPIKHDQPVNRSTKQIFQYQPPPQAMSAAIIAVSSGPLTDADSSVTWPTPSCWQLPQSGAAEGARKRNQDSLCLVVTVWYC